MIFKEVTSGSSHSDAVHLLFHDLPSWLFLRIKPKPDPLLFTILSGSRDDHKAGVRGDVSWLPDGPRGQLSLPVVQGLMDWDFETSGARMTSVAFLETNQELRRPEGHSNKAHTLYILWDTFAKTLAQYQAVCRGRAEGQWRACYFTGWGGKCPLHGGFLGSLRLWVSAWLT